MEHIIEEDQKALFGKSINWGGNPTICKWFQEKELKVLELSSGQSFAVVKVKNKDSKYEHYAVCLAENIEKRFGGKEAATSEYKHLIYKLNVDSDLVMTYACTK